VRGSLADHDTLQSVLHRFAQRGDAPAVMAFAGDEMQVTSFAALADRALGLARDLARRGVGAGATIALIAPNSLAWITAYWAIVATGATVMPIDAQMGGDDASPMLALARCRLVFTTEARAKRLPHGCEAIVLDHDLPHAADGGAAFATAKPEDAALLLFTSGTTGTPKAVPLSHANLLSNINAIAAAGLVVEGDRALLPLPLHHAYPLTVGMMTGFACGVALVLPAGVSGPELIAALKRGRATVLLGVPRLYTALLAGIGQRIAAQPALARRLFALMLALSSRVRRMSGVNLGRFLFGAVHRQLAPDLRLLVSGGAKLDGEVEESLAALGWGVMTGYGLTETSPILAFNRPGAAKQGSVGRPLPGVELRIANRDPDGVGEIEAKGASVFEGYRGDEAVAKRAFTADGWFRTGDFGRVDGGGYLHIVARVSEAIVLADGKKLFPDAVEAIYADHPLVKEIALFARDGALVGLVVPDLDRVREGGALGMKDMIRDALAERAKGLPSHARLSGFAVGRDKLPRTQLGKIRRHLVPALYEAALSGHERAAPAELSPDDLVLLEEPGAAAVWDWLKARFPDRTLALDMSPQLDLGIDSLGWVDLTLALERDLGVRFTEQEIGRIVTLRDLLREAKAAGARLPGEGAPQPAQLPHLGPGQRLAQRLGAALVRLVMRRFFALAVEGAENLPARGPYLICPNHQSYLDPLAVEAALPPKLVPRTWWAGWTGILFTSRLRRSLSRIAQIMPVDPYRGGAASLALAAQVFERGEALVWFPEGGIARDGKLQRFQAGVGVLVERHHVAIVPVAIDGSFEALPYDKGFPPRRHPIHVRFGEAIDPAPLVASAAGNPQRIADALHDEVARLAGQ
jgi:long-chain acyl-CoA synthetase